MPTSSQAAILEAWQGLFGVCSASDSQSCWVKQICHLYLSWSDEQIFFLPATETLMILFCLNLHLSLSMKIALIFVKECEYFMSLNDRWDNQDFVLPLDFYSKESLTFLLSDCLLLLQFIFYHDGYRGQEVKARIHPFSNVFHPKIEIMFLMVHH